jgi:hypothetical protein
MRRWRVPTGLSAVVVLAQLFSTTALHDVATGEPAAGLRLAYPFLHVAFAPLTLLADWLNGGSTGDLYGFGAWVGIVFAAARLLRPGRLNAESKPESWGRRLGRELIAVVCLAAGVGLFLWWGVRWNRPIPRLVSTDSALIIFDVHSHTSASHDGRPGFGSAANAAWHQRAGFDAAFVTDHNTFGGARPWQRDRAGAPPRLLDAEELSLNGIHMLVLGNDTLIHNTPWASSFDSSLALLNSLQPSAFGIQPYVVASLPEYWRNHWGPDVGRVIASGVRGIEVWTTSPRAMDFPPVYRREVVARARSLGLAIFGATDMHGLGNAATVWNAVALPGWRALGDSALTAALLTRFRADPGAVRVVAMRRRIAPTRALQAIGLPFGVWIQLRSASLAHAAALLGWIWLIALARRRIATGKE